MVEKTVSYDFEIMNFVTVKAPYGTNPDTLVDLAFVELIKLTRRDGIEFHCMNTLDDDGEYEPIPEEWYGENHD